MTVAWTPTTADVAPIVPNRTQDISGDFTANTVPTATQATSHIIAKIVDEVLAVVGPLHRPILGALTEPDRIGRFRGDGRARLTDDSAYDAKSKYQQLQARYNALLDSSGPPPKTAPGAEQPLPVFGFPDRTTSPPFTLTTDF